MIYFLRRILFYYFRPYWKQCLLQLLALATLIVFDTLFPLGTKFLIDLAIVPQDSRMLILLMVGLAVLYLVSSVGSMGSDYMTAWIIARVTNDMRLKMFSHLQTLSASYYARTQTGDIITRFNADLAAIETALGYSVIMGIQYVTQLIISIGVLFMLDVPLAAVTVIILPLTAIFPKRVADRASDLINQRRSGESGINSTVQENLQAHTVTRMFGLRELSIRAFIQQLNRFAHVVTRSLFSGWMVNRTTNMGQYLIQLLVICIGAYLVFIGHLSIGSWVGFTSLLISVGYGISLLSTSFAGLVPAVTSLQRIESLLDEKILVSDTPDITLPRFSKDIIFDQVTFSYAKNTEKLEPDVKPNLDHVHFTIPCGKSVAFIGRSGSGKSTALNLLMRSYDPQSGRILVDNQNIQNVSLASLRAQMGVVFQDTFLFNISLRENIRLGKMGASDAEIEEAARAAGVHDTIMKLPAGYNTLAGEQGKGLSGGQRQRIALARAIIRHPAILLLDEATSALDPETETQIYETLKELKRSCTIISVTHRLAPVADMDQIVVMDQGQVVEVGTHADLLRLGGLYYHLSTQQGGFTISPDGQTAEVTPSRLRGIPLFEALDDATLAQIATQFVTEWVDAGHTVIQEGEIGDKFYLIVRGKSSVTVTGPEGQPVSMRNLQDGDYFGEIALLEGGGRRTASVRTIIPSLFLTLKNKHFSNMVANYPAIRTAVEQAARNRLSASASKTIPEQLESAI
jgi:ATP-binding cassette, subfamily B, bacterial